MSGSSSALAWSSALEDFTLFRTFSAEQQVKVLNALVRQDLVRGQMLVTQGGPWDSLFLVLHGTWRYARPAMASSSNRCRAVAITLYFIHRIAQL